MYHKRSKNIFDASTYILKIVIGINIRAINHAYQDFEIKVQLTWFALHRSILFLISFISSNYRISILVGSLGSFLIVAL